MSGWHPQSQDGGIPPNPATPTSPAQAFAPSVLPIDTDALYYSNGCDVRLRPAVLNTLISEGLALIDRVGLAYRPARLTNLRTGVEYITQKGMPKWLALTPQASPVHMYFGALDPPLLGGLNNGMVLTVLPMAVNQGFIQINVGDGTWVRVRRNDSQELEDGDWPANIPQTITHYNGTWYMIGAALSQIRKAVPDASFSAVFALTPKDLIIPGYCVRTKVPLSGTNTSLATVSAGTVTIQGAGLYAVDLFSAMQCSHPGLDQIGFHLYLDVNDVSVTASTDIMPGTTNNWAGLSCSHTRYFPAETRFGASAAIGSLITASNWCRVNSCEMTITRLG